MIRSIKRRNDLMSGGTALIWMVALIYGAALIMFVAHWVGQGVRHIQRQRRVSRPRVVCRLRTGG